jgi:hypothetical protein
MLLRAAYTENQLAWRSHFSPMAAGLKPGPKKVWLAVAVGAYVADNALQLAQKVILEAAKKQ